MIILYVLHQRPYLSSNVPIFRPQNYRQLRIAGITVRKTIDVIIATFCMLEGLALLHDDRDFEPIAAHFPLKEIKVKER